MNTYQTLVHFDMSISDQKVISLLYGPLLGHEAYRMYHTLYHLNHHTEKIYNEDFIFSVLHMKSEQFLKSRHILESFELLQTYEHNASYILQLKRPLTAKGFLTDVIFGVFLEHTMGKTYVDDIILIFEVQMPELSTYGNISKTFSDVYAFSHHKLLKLDVSLYDNGGQKYKRHVESISLDALMNALPKRYQKPQLLKPDIIEMLNQIAFIYQFNIENLKEVIMRLDPQTLDSKQQLLLQAKMYYHQLEKTMDINPVEQTQSDVLTDISPYYIIQKYGVMDAYATSLDTVAQLVSRNHVEMGIINTLILFVLKRKQGVLPHINYLEKILSSWLSKGIKTTKDATDLVSLMETSYVPSKTKVKVRSVEPAWLEEFLNDLDQEEAKR